MKKVGKSESRTPHKISKEYLRESEELYRSLFENSMDAILLTGPDGSVFSANPAARKMFGWSKEEICRLGRNGLVDNSDPRLYKGLLLRERNGSVFGELTMIRKNGERFPVEISSNIFRDPSGKERTSMIIRDISERKQSMEALKESVLRFKQISMNSVNWIWEVDQTGLFTYSSPVVEEILGYKSEELIDKKYFYDLFKPEDRKRLKKAAFLLFVRKETFRDFININVNKNGREVFLSTSGLPILDSSVNLTGYRGVAIDITARIASDEKLRKSEEDLRKSKELMEKLNHHLNEIRENERALISREVHDELGQSMTALKLDLNQMYKYFSNNQEAVKRLDNMIGLISNTIKIVQRISSDLRPGILDDLGLVAAIEWYCDEFENRTGIKCSIELDNSDYNDSRKSLTFFRVLQECLTNVIRHSRATYVNVELHNSRKGTTLTIHDNGIGIPAEKIDSYNSMGLINVRERVRQFNGKVTILSKYGKGTKITVFIPS